MVSGCTGRWIWGLYMLSFVRALDNNISTLPESSERQLINTLLQRYDGLSHIPRPRKDSSKSVRVQFGIRLVHLDLDEKEQMMRTSVWIRLAWYDDYLKWNQSEYGVSDIVLPYERVWTPDIVLVNTGQVTVQEQEANLQVSHEGRVFWAPQRKYGSACLIDVTEYPFDKHTCDMWFQSIANPSHKLNITPYYKSPLDLDTYLTSYKFSQAWTILSNTTSWVKRPRDVGMVLMYSRRASLRCSLTVQRRPGFIGMLLIVPCCLLSLLIPLIFCFPIDRPDRHYLAMSVFASLSVLLWMVNDVVPSSAAFVPRLALYYCANILNLLLATCCSVAVVNISQRSEMWKHVPHLVKVIFIHHFGRLLCYGTRLEYMCEEAKAHEICSSPILNNEQVICSPPILNNQLPEKSSEPDMACLVSIQAESLSKDVYEGNDDAYQEITTRLSIIENSLQEHGASTQRQTCNRKVPLSIYTEWRSMSLVLDRLFCILFFLFDIITLAVFHPRMSQGK